RETLEQAIFVEAAGAPRRGAAHDGGPPAHRVGERALCVKTERDAERTRRSGGDARRAAAAFGDRHDPRSKRPACRAKPAQARPALARRKPERGGERPLDAAAIAALAPRRRALGSEPLARGRGTIAPEP